MPIHDRRYRGYDGPRTGQLERFLVLPRYALREVFRPRSFTALFTASFAFPVACAVLIYVQHNLSLVAGYAVSLPVLIGIDATFFAVFLWVQTTLAFVLTVVLVPGVVSPDLVNGALPLYLSRPLTRWRYLAGKVSVLLLLLSAVTWAPGVLLYLLESTLAGGGYLWRSSRLLLGIVAGSWVAIVFIGLPALAVSVHLRSKARARGALVFLVFAVAAVGQIGNAVLDTRWGEALIAPRLLGVIYAGLLGMETEPGLPLWGAFITVGVACSLSLAVIARRLRAFEVVA